MADRTIQVNLTGEWLELAAAAGMVDGSRYQVDIVKAQVNATVYTAETDDASTEPTAAIIGHPIKPYARNRGTDPRQFEKEAGIFPWVRVDRGTAILCITPIG